MFLAQQYIMTLISNLAPAYIKCIFFSIEMKRHITQVFHRIQKNNFQFSLTQTNNFRFSLLANCPNMLPTYWTILARIIITYSKILLAKHSFFSSKIFALQGFSTFCTTKTFGMERFSGVLWSNGFIFYNLVTFGTFFQEFL